MEISEVAFIFLNLLDRTDRSFSFANY